MKNLLPFIFYIILSSPTLLYSQNWQSVKLHQNNFYNCLPSQGDIWNVNAIRIDTAYLSGTDSVFLNFFTIRDTAQFTFPSCVNLHGASWLGSHVVEDTNGVNTFFNSNEDSIKINTRSPINQSWHLYNYANGDYLEATVNSITWQLVNGNADSVKQITIQSRDNTGTSIANLFNGKDILISKQYGIIKLYEFYNFPIITSTPFDTLSFRLSNSHLMTIGEVYDYNVGDQFGSYEDCGSLPPTQTLSTVLEKHFSTALDTVFYHFKTETITPVYVALPSPHIEYVYSVDTSSWVSYTNLNQLICNTMPMENGLIDSASSVLPHQNPAQYLMDDGDPNVHCGLESYTFAPSSLYFLSSSCVSYTFEENDQTTRVIKGCGFWQVNRVDNTAIPPINCNGNLTYIHKGAFVCGTPPDLTVGINDLKKETTITIAPNPFSSSTTIYFSEIQNNVNLKITDVLGNEIKSMVLNNASNITIDKGTMKPSVYFLQITNGMRNYIYRKIVVE